MTVLGEKRESLTVPQDMERIMEEVLIKLLERVKRDV